MNKKIIIISIIIFILILILGIFFVFKMKKKNVISNSNKYKVILTIDGKKETKEVKDNDTLKLEKIEKEGYVFKGWKDKSGKIYTDEVKITKDMELEPVFEKKEEVNQTPTTEEENQAKNNTDNKSTDTKKELKSYYCDRGYTLRGTNCVKVETVNATSSEECPAGYIVNDYGKCAHFVEPKINCEGIYPQFTYREIPGDKCQNADGHIFENPVFDKCYGEYVQMVHPHSNTLKCGKIGAKVRKYSCPAGYSLSGTSCLKTITVKAKIK